MNRTARRQALESAGPVSGEWFLRALLRARRDGHVRAAISGLG